jgi:hypothetical protein
MSRRARPQAASDSPYLPALVLLFAGSGCAALIYQIVWLQLLQLVVGSSAISLAVLLATFMGGMCLGSLILPRKVDASHHPLRVYAPRARHRGRRPGDSLGHADRQRPVCRRRRPADRAGGRCGHLSAAADRAHGCDAAGDRAMGRGDAVRGRVARVLLRRQHRRRGRQDAGDGVLSPPRLRRRDRDVCPRFMYERW